MNSPTLVSQVRTHGHLGSPQMEMAIATKVVASRSQLSGRFQLRHTLGLFDPPGQHWERGGDVSESAEHHQACGDEFTHLLLKLDDGCLGLSPACLAVPDVAATAVL
ncbi:MAG: hypothetical protein M3069_22120 [Chloroflexota bacterium]|nr:hypothetical protein [Chloroflexota bacterium]